jgi:hypothetical protein
MKTLCYAVAPLDPVWNRYIWTLIILVIILCILYLFASKSRIIWKLKFELLTQIMSGIPGSLDTITSLKKMPLRVINQVVFENYLFEYFCKIIKTWNIFEISKYILFLRREIPNSRKRDHLMKFFLQAWEHEGQDRLAPFYIKIILQECRGQHANYEEIKNLMIRVIKNSDRPQGQYLQQLEAGVEILLQDEEINNDIKDLVKAEVVKFRQRLGITRNTSIPLNDN